MVQEEGRGSKRWCRFAGAGSVVAGKCKVWRADLGYTDFFFEWCTGVSGCGWWDEFLGFVVLDGVVCKRGKGVMGRRRKEVSPAYCPRWSGEMSVSLKNQVWALELLRVLQVQFALLESTFNGTKFIDRKLHSMLHHS